MLASLRMCTRVLIVLQCARLLRAFLVHGFTLFSKVFICLSAKL